MIEFSHVSKLFGAQKAVNDLNLNFSLRVSINS